MVLVNIIDSTITAMTSLIPPLHLLSFSTLLGTELYQTFVITKVAYNALPRTAFTSLQKQLFPIYFQSQSLSLFLTAVTFPPSGPLGLIQHKGDWIPFTIAGVTTILNLLIYGPRTRQSMIDRIHQVTRDAKNANNPAEQTPEMAAIIRQFKKNHAMCIHLNLISIGAMLWYGCRLGSHLQF